MEVKLFIFAAVTISSVFSLCGPRDTKLVNFQTKLKRRTNYVVVATTKKCPGLDEFYYKWIVIETPSSRIILESHDANLLIEGYKYDPHTCYKSVYIVTLTVSHYPDMAMGDNVEGSFTFVPEKMHIEIDGGTEKTHMQGQDLIVDASKLSRDESYSPHEDAFAGNIITWTIRPALKNFTAPSSLLLRVPKFALQKNVMYLFTVEVRRIKIPGYIDLQRASQYVDVISKIIPHLNMKCIRNCINSHNLEPTAFIIECEKFCEDLRFYWTLHPKPRGRVDFGTGYNRIIIYENAYDPGQRFSITVKCNGARFVKSVQFIKGTKKGKCQVYPKEGLSLVTKFQISCKGFSSPYGITAYMIYQYFGSEKVLIDTYNGKDISEVFLSSGVPTTLAVKVHDNAFLQQEVYLTLNVREYFSESTVHLGSTIKSLVLAQDINSIKSYSYEGFTDKVVQLVSLLLVSMRKFELDKLTTKDLHKHMAEAILRSSPFTFPDIIQKLLILKRLLYFKADEDTTTSTLIAKAMLKNARALHSLRMTHTTINVPHFYVVEFWERNVKLFSDLLTQSNEVMNILNEPHPPHYYESYDDLDSRKIQIREDFKSVISYMISVFEVNSVTMLFKAIPDQKSDYFESENICIKSKRKTLYDSPQLMESTKRITFEGATSSIVVLSERLVSDLKTKSKYAEYNFAVFKKNPFWWHQNASSFTADFILFDLFVAKKKLKAVNYPFFIDLEFHAVPARIVNGTLREKSIVAYRIELEDNTLLQIEIESVSSDLQPFKVTWSECFCNDEDFSSSNAVNITDENEYRNSLTVRTNKETKFIYLCIKRITPKLSYFIKFAAFSCLHWDVTSKEWQGEKCRVVKTTAFTPRPRLLCECSHLSLFTGRVIIPETSMNFVKEFDLAIDKMQNFLMVKVVGMLLLLWLFFLLLAHRKDKAAQKKNVILKLDDTVPGDRHPYLVVVFTGIFFDAHTTADVAIQLVGERAKSRVHVLKCRDVTLLSRNSQDWFMLFSPYYLGKLKKIRLWHNCKGKYPHWYCERVIVQDMKTSKQYCFTVEKWFSLIWGKGKYYRTIILKKGKQKKKALFKAQLEKNLKDNHIWMSILTRDLQSNFNSKERVSVGFCFLFLSMLVNALLYGIPNGTPQDSIDEQSSFYISIANVVIFVLSWLVATPMGLFIIFIFKNSAPL